MTDPSSDPQSGGATPGVPPESTPERLPAISDPGVLEVIRELRASGLNNLEEVVRQGIEATQFSNRGAGAVELANNMAVQAAGDWTFISPQYIYKGSSGGGPRPLEW